jgi:GTP cyclohydrolase II
MNRMVSEQNGILFYLRFDGRGAGLSAKVAATKLETQGVDTYDSRLQIGVEPEGRDFSNIGKFLMDKGFRKIKLLTNNPNKKNDLVKSGLEVEVEAMFVENPNINVKKLYDTKVTKFNHSIKQFLVD